ncbi:PREDICTED: inactive rhomboid protein 2-like, partial [Amphimedon queenslandica]|uniref:Rhomboid-like protein n=1 Tax=Amphimedon queenslandica TaxID=400682 RepID=A0A1X7SSG9_AMPQE
MSTNVTGWPICTDSVASNSEHLSCRVTGRPCCVGIQAQCIITSQEHCDFLEGKFHKDAFLCSQVNCLKGICGLTPFGKTPDQIQRLGLAVFLHAGIFHVLLTIIFNFYILRDLEKYLGWLATATLYIGSGIGGNIISALFVPYSAEVGPAASMFGVIAFFLIFIVYHWNFFDRAWLEMLKYSIIVVLLFLIGFLPYIDNYARIGGFLFGMMFSFIQIHYIPQHDCMTEFNSFRFPNQKAKSSLLGKIALLITGLVLLLTLYIFSFLWFYLEGDVWNGFSYLNCIIPTSLSNLCQDYRQDISA